MISPFCERAIESALLYGNALLKFISPNDVGLTGGHQYGFYLPKSVYGMYTPHPPEKGVVTKHSIRIQWQDDVVTDSVITWYGDKTRSEYRLTRFGRGFPYLAHDMVGDLLVLIRSAEDTFLAYILDLEEDIDDIQNALGVQVFDSWAIFQNGVERFESEDECIERIFRKFAQSLKQLPSGEVFSAESVDALRHCLHDYSSLDSDKRIVAGMETEYRLYKLCERQVYQNDIVRVFRDVDDFLNTANSILNRRKSRAGRALENHVERALVDANIPHQMLPRKIDGKPDIILPDEKSYLDPQFPIEKLFVVGVKTTCKDRWRQVLREGKRVPKKYILTMQPGISGGQLEEMRDANVTLVVPKSLHSKYPKVENMDVLSVENFFESARAGLT